MNEVSSIPLSEGPHDGELYYAEEGSFPATVGRPQGPMVTHEDGTVSWTTNEYQLSSDLSRYDWLGTYYHEVNFDSGDVVNEQVDAP